MGLGGIIGAIPSLIGIGGGLAGLFGGDTPSAQAPSYGQLTSPGMAYNPPATFNPSLSAQQQPFDQYSSLMQPFLTAAAGGGGANYPAQLYGQYGAAAQPIIAASNDPNYGGQALHTANYIGQIGPAYGNMQLGNARQLYAMGDLSLPYSSSILNTGFDPENALRAREEQRLSDSTSAALSRSGVANTPYGQGVLGETMKNFGLDWQDRALGRMNQATTGYGNLVSGAGRAYAGGAEQANSGLGTILNTASIPYQTMLGQAQNSMGAIQNLANFGMQGWNLPQSALNNVMGLMGQQRGQLGLGLGAAQNAANYNLQAANYGLNSNAQNFNQNQIYGANLGQGIAGLTRGLGNVFSGTGWGGNSSVPMDSSLGSTGLGFTFS